MKSTTVRVCSSWATVFGVALLCAESARAINNSVEYIRADQLHALGYRGQGDDVAIIDSGIDILVAGAHNPTLDDLDTDITRMDFTGSLTPNDSALSTRGHGTHVTGIIASNHGTYTGVAPGVDLLGPKVFGGPNGGDTVLLNGTEWANGQGAEIFNMSLGALNTTSNGTNDKFQRYVDFIVDNPARTAGMVSDTMDEWDMVFIAAGNGSQFSAGVEPSSPVETPGSAYNAMTIGATTANYQQVANWSSRRGVMSFGNDSTDLLPGLPLVDDDGDGTVDEVDEFGAPGSTDSLIDIGPLRSKPDLVAPGSSIRSTNNDWGPTIGTPPLVTAVRPEGNNDGNPATPAPGGDDDTYDFVTKTGTSMATPHAAGVAALLQEVVQENLLSEPGTPAFAGNDHKVIKSIMMTGTDKVGQDPAAAGVTRDRDGSVWSNLPNIGKPLDDGLGSGQLDAKNAYDILIGGEENPTNITGERVDHVAWDIHHVINVAHGNQDTRAYTFQQRLEAGSWLTATLAWDRHVTWTDDGDSAVEFTDAFTYEPLEIMSMFLWQGMFNNPVGLVASSISMIDNIQHIHFQIPTTDFYTLLVRDEVGGDGETYGLSWWTTPVPEPMSLVLLATGALALSLRRH